MVNPEIKTSSSQEFSKRVYFYDPEKSPLLVASQTFTLLSLFRQQAIRKPDLAKDYFRDYTMNYLDRARDGSDIIYNKEGITPEIEDMAIKEASHHALVVFAHLHANLKSRFLPDGFSRRGILKAPETKDEFLRRIEEIKIGVWQIMETKFDFDDEIFLNARSLSLKAYGFFRVGSELPIKLPEDEKKKEQMEKEKFNDLLEGIDVRL